MECPNENSLLDYLEGRLKGAAEERIAEHVRGCSSCREVVSVTSMANETLVGESAGSTPGEDPRATSKARGEAAAALIGQKIGEYEVEALIGSGGMGLVYRAVQPIIGKPVAIKVLRPELAADTSHMRRMVNEARAVTSIGHRGVVDIFSFGELPDGRQYLVMEFLVGRPLNRIVREQAPLPFGELLKLLEGILEALGAAHAAGVIHRDLKPSNLFVVEPPHGEPYVKLLDFGLARRERTNTGHTRIGHDVLGTPAYMAPEQVRAQAVSARTDLYAFGIVAYELATGKRPFRSASMADLLAAQVKSPPPPPSSHGVTLPAGFEGLLLRLLAKDPAQRPASTAEVLEELKLVSRVDEVTRRAPELTAPRRSWTLPLLGAGLVGAVFIGAAVQRLATADTADYRPTVRSNVRVLEFDAGVPQPVEEAADAGLPIEVPVVKAPSLRVVVKRHLATLQARLKQRTPAGETPNSLVSSLLRDAEVRLGSAKSDAELKSIDAGLADLERKYLPK